MAGRQRPIEEHLVEELRPGVDPAPEHPLDADAAAAAADVAQDGEGGGMPEGGAPGTPGAGGGRSPAF